LLPLNVTAQTGFLGWIDGLICQDGLDGSPQIFSCDHISQSKTLGQQKKRLPIQRVKGMCNGKAVLTIRVITLAFSSRIGYTLGDGKRPSCGQYGWKEAAQEDLGI